jgi:hypothetical protein
VFFALLVTLTATACGGRAAPTQPSMTTPAVSLPAGPYLLKIDLSSTGDPVCTPGAVCTAVSVCIGTPSGPLSATMPVRVERAGATAAVLPDDPVSSFGMALQIDAETAVGTARGTFLEGGRSITLTGESGPIASATGVLAAGRATGKFDGQLSMGGYSCANNGHTWNLTPR